VSLVISSGEWVGLVGKNGCGKSTLGRIVAGALKPDNGEVRIDGIVIDHNNETNFSDRKIAIIQADPENQFITSTVSDEISFALQLMDYSPSEINDALIEALDKFDLIKYRNTHPFYLSVGEQFRVLLAVAWARKPRYLILDEFFAMVDAVTRENLLHFLRKLSMEDKVGILLISHRMEELIDISRLLVMNEGCIIFEAQIDESIDFIQSHPELGVEIPILYEIAQYLSVNERQELDLNFPFIRGGHDNGTISQCKSPGN